MFKLNSQKCIYKTKQYRGFLPLYKKNIERTYLKAQTDHLICYNSTCFPDTWLTLSNLTAQSQPVVSVKMGEKPKNTAVFLECFHIMHICSMIYPQLVHVMQLKMESGGLFMRVGLIPCFFPPTALMQSF